MKNDEVEAALVRVLAAPSFQRADRQSALLRYLVDAHLGSVEVKESVIALEFFGKKDYDPHHDSLVRVEIGKLRQRLAKHYETGGTADPVRLEIPKGAYAVLVQRSPLPVQAPPEPLPVPAATGRRIPLIAGAALAMVMLTGAVIWLSRPKPVPPPGATYIAVLPFVDMSPGKDQGYFCDGLTEELIHLLSGYNSIRVASRTSVFQFRGVPQDAREVGRKLGAQVVIEGSVRREGNRIRVTAQVINAADGYHLFSETYDRDFNEVLAIQEELAASIGRALRWDLLTLGTGRVLGRPRTRNPQAFHQYLLATRKANFSEPVEAIELYRTAVALDPQYALAWAGIAIEAITTVDWGIAPPAEALAEASEAARKAMALDNTLAEAQQAAGRVRACHDHDWKGADEAFRRAVELDPEYVYFQEDWVRFALQPVGRFPEAVSVLQRALTAQPGNNHLRNGLAGTYIRMGQYDLAKQSLEVSLKTNARAPAVHVMLSQAATAEGRHAEALRHIEDAARIWRSPWVLGEMSYAYAKAGRRVDAAKVLAELLAMEPRRVAYETAVAQSVLGDREGALSSLERALAMQSIAMLWIKFDVRLKDLHAEPRFQQLLKKLRLS
ncbi:MAG: tetratricopeptide repeat protein [Acidobacteria bacterium]|nr:tetratricopeptide repeat protein [Acidobacteriota bacterium]